MMHIENTEQLDGIINSDNDNDIPSNFLTKNYFVPEADVVKELALDVQQISPINIYQRTYRLPSSNMVTMLCSVLLHLTPHFHNRKIQVFLFRIDTTERSFACRLPTCTDDFGMWWDWLCNSKYTRLYDHEDPNDFSSPGVVRLFIGDNDR